MTTCACSQKALELWFSTSRCHTKPVRVRIETPHIFPTVSALILFSSDVEIVNQQSRRHVSRTKSILGWPWFESLWPQATRPGLFTPRWPQIGPVTHHIPKSTFELNHDLALYLWIFKKSNQLHSHSGIAPHSHRHVWTLCVHHKCCKTRLHRSGRITKTRIWLHRGWTIPGPTKAGTKEADSNLDATGVVVPVSVCKLCISINPKLRNMLKQQGSQHTLEHF